jgi:hypothetical protein
VYLAFTVQCIHLANAFFCNHATFQGEGKLLNYRFSCCTICNRHSSVSIVSEYELDDRAIRIRSPAETQGFSSILCVQTGSGVLPVSCPVGTGGHFPGAKARPGRDGDHSPPSSAEVMNELKLYFLSPQAPPWSVVGRL